MHHEEDARVTTHHALQSPRPEHSAFSDRHIAFTGGLRRTDLRSKHVITRTVQELRPQLSLAQLSSRLLHGDGPRGLGDIIFWISIQCATAERFEVVVIYKDGVVDLFDPVLNVLLTLFHSLKIVIRQFSSWIADSLMTGVAPLQEYLHPQIIIRLSERFKIYPSCRLNKF